MSFRLARAHVTNFCVLAQEIEEKDMSVLREIKQTLAEVDASQPDLHLASVPNRYSLSVK